MQVSSSSGRGVTSSKGGRGPGSKAKDPIQERKEAQLADEAQVHMPYHSMLSAVCWQRQCIPAYTMQTVNKCRAATDKTHAVLTPGRWV